MHSGEAVWFPVQGYGSTAPWLLISLNLSVAVKKDNYTAELHIIRALGYRTKTLHMEFLYFP